MSVVVGYVATPEGAAALEAAAAEATTRGVPLIVILSERSARFGAESHDTDRAASEVRDRLSGTAVEHDVRVVGPGRDVAEEIIEAAQTSAAELIVIGLRRRSPVGKLLLGSNAQRILLDAPCPVLAVKPPSA